MAAAVYVFPPETFASPILVDGPGATDSSYVEVRVAGTGAGDPHVRFTIPSGTSWYAGPDNSDSDKFIIGTGTAVGTAGLVYIETGGNVGIGGTPSFLLDANGTSAGGTVTSAIRNLSSAASSSARFSVLVAATAAGDPFTHYAVNGGGADWAIGTDNSITAPGPDPFCISRSSQIGTADVVRCFADRVHLSMGATAPGEGRWIRRAHVQTTDATVTTVATIAIGASKLHALRVSLVGMRSTLAEAAYYERLAAYKNNAGTVTLIGAAASPITAEDAAGWDITLTISTTNVLVQVTGAAASTVEWECVVEEVVTAGA